MSGEPNGAVLSGEPNGAVLSGEPNGESSLPVTRLPVMPGRLLRRERGRGLRLSGGDTLQCSAPGWCTIGGSIHKAGNGSPLVDRNQWIVDVARGDRIRDRWCWLGLGGSEGTLATKTSSPKPSTLMFIDDETGERVGEPLVKRY